MRQLGEWSVERQMHDGSWHCFGQGFISLTTAKACCKGHAPLQGIVNYRVSNNENDVYTASLVAGQRAKWKKVT